jgi:photosystem II stability/assembly factor-like uncharacterized protein
VLALAVVALVLVAVLSASANPPNAAEIRIQGWVNELQQERLTAQRHNAQKELENTGEAAVPALMVALRSQNAVLRRNAADMLGFIASPTAVSSLQYALANDAVPAVRRNAAWALGEIESFSALGDLQRAVVLDSNELVRQTAQDSLARLRTRIALSAGIDERALNAYAVAPQSADMLYAASRRDLKVTRDGGATWDTLENALPSMANVLAVSPANSLTLYAGVDSMGIYKSVDGGREWVAMNEGLQVAPGAQFVISAITIDPTDPQRLIIATGARLGTGDIEFVPTGILTSHNGGATWNVVRQGTQGEALTQLQLKGNQVFALAGTKVMVYRFD